MLKVTKVLFVGPVAPRPAHLEALAELLSAERGETVSIEELQVEHRTEPELLTQPHFVADEVVLQATRKDRRGRIRALVGPRTVIEADRVEYRDGNGRPRCRLSYIRERIPAHR